MIEMIHEKSEFTVPINVLVKYLGEGLLSHSSLVIEILKNRKDCTKRSFQVTSFPEASSGNWVQAS